MESSPCDPMAAERLSREECASDSASASQASSMCRTNVAATRTGTAPRRNPSKPPSRYAPPNPPAALLQRFSEPCCCCCCRQRLNVFAYKSSQALLFAGNEPFPTIYVESQKEGEVGVNVFS